MRYKVATAIIGKAESFFKPILPYLDQWRQDFLPQLIRGVVMSEGLVVTEVVREAFESPEGFRAGYKAFSRHLNSAVWDDQEDRIRREIQGQVGREIGSLTPIAVDDGEVAKPYARKMERLGRILDSDKEVITNGYWSFEAYGVEDPEAPKPLVNFPYDVGGEEFPSRQHARRSGYRQIQNATRGKGVVVEDRGFDADENYEDMNEAGLRWLVRLVGNREIEDSAGESMGIVEDFCATWRLTHVTSAAGKWVDGEEQPKMVAYDFMPVRLPRVRGNFWMIVVRRCTAPAEGGMFLLTNVPLILPADAERMIRAYHHRWRAEDSIRFMKTALGIEGVRTLNFRPLRRLIMIAYWVMAMISVLRLKLTPTQLKKTICVGKFFDRPVRLLHYRLLTGLRYYWKNSGVT